MKKLLTLCTMLSVLAISAYASKIEAKSAAPSSKSNSTALSINNSEVPVDVDVKIAELENQLAELRANGGDQTDVRAMLDKYRSLSTRMREENPTLDRACADCAPADADLGFIGNVTYAYFVSGNCGTDGKWIGRFDGVAGTVYHFDLCSSSPGAGTNSGFDAVSDCDLRVRDAACVQLAYVDGLSSCTPSWSPNDFQWTCAVAGTYYVDIQPYSGGCQGDANMTFTMNYYGAGVLPPPANDVCTGAATLAVPGVTTGSTLNATDNYNAVCPYTQTGGKDVVYTYTPAASQGVTFSLCQSSYDTKLYIATECPPVNIVACNDDASPCPGSTGSYRSYLECVSLLGGQQYFIYVDGYSSSDFGDYVLETTVCEACSVPCPDGAIVDEEQSCGDEYVDLWNAGCNSPVGTPAAYSSLNCGDTFCGTIWTYLYQGGQYRDTDWFLITVTDDLDSNKFCLTTEFAGAFFLLPLAPCEDINNGLVTPIISAGTLPCVPACFDQCLLPGQYIVVVTSAGFTGVPCNSHYVLSRECRNCAEPFVCHCGEGDNTHCTYATDGGVWPYNYQIMDYDTTYVPVQVPFQYQITDVNVCLDLTHTFDGDVELWLISPSGTRVELSTRNGSSGDNYVCTTFDDEALNSILTGVAPFSGSFIPEGSLATFDGENAYGNWLLEVSDQAGGDSGYVSRVCLSFTYDTILPVAFGSFDAQATDKEVTLNWNTSSEHNMDRFEISRDGSVIANVAAQNSSSGSNYSYTDNNLTNGTSYSYTLVSVDVNGTRETLATLSATPTASNAVVTEYSLHQNYPNPFNPTTNIAFDMVEAGHVSISVFNIMGQKVAELVNGNMTAGRHIVSFDGTGLSSGLYLYKMEANGFTAQSKMILMK